MLSDLVRKAKDTIKTVKFIFFVLKSNLFSTNEFSKVFSILIAYLDIQKSNVRDTVVSNRNIKRSFNLLSVLVESYFKNGESKVTLSQILEVLSEEFIRREKNVK